MKRAAGVIGHAVAQRWKLSVVIMIGFVVLYEAALMVALVVRFGDVPNYVTFYNYPANVYQILVNTPSLEDAVSIIGNEWLIEIGHMNYDYGNGVSEWSLTVLPTKLAVLFALGALVAANVALLLPNRAGVCAIGSRGPALAAVGGGASLVGMASVTISWVVCCATPSWVVGLTMLGMSTTLALWLEPFGTYIALAGFALLIATLFLLARGHLQSGESGHSAHPRAHSIA